MIGRRGEDAIKDAIERRENSGGGGGDINFYSWKPEETKLLRFLTDGDEIILVYLHERIKCYDDKQRTFVCHLDTGHDSCPLCDAGFKRREVGYGLAVLRDEVVEDGKVVGFKDVTVEVKDKDGKTSVQPYVGVVNQSIQNFWHFVDAHFRRYGSLHEFDLEINRKGAELETTYLMFNMPPVEIKDFKERYSKFAPDLEGFLKRMGSMEYYKERFLGETKEKSETQEFSEPVRNSSESEVSQALGDEQSELERMSALRKQIIEEESQPY